MRNLPDAPFKLLLFIVILIMAFVLGMVYSDFLNLVPTWGHYILAVVPDNDMLRDYNIGMMWAIALGFSILLWPVPESDKRCLLWLWLAKCAVTLGFMLIYENGFGILDAYGYFAASLRDDFPWQQVSIGGSGTTNIAVIAWVHNQIFPASYHALKVSFSMIGLLGVYLFYQFLILLTNCRKLKWLYLLGLYPSILFWSSILGKDPIVFLGISIYCYGVLKWYKSQNYSYIVLAIAGVLLAIFIRIWLGVILLFPLMVFAVVSTRSFIARLVMAGLTVALFLVMVNQFSSYFAVESLDEMVSTVDTLAQGQATGGSAQDIPRFFNVRDMITFFPIALFTTLFRPLPGELMTPFGLLAGIENFLLLIYFVAAIRRTQWQTWRETPVMWIVLLILTWASLYGFFSSSNLGAAVRFKLQILPVLLSFVIYLRVISQRHKITKSHQYVRDFL